MYQVEERLQRVIREVLMKVIPSPEEAEETERVSELLVSRLEEEAEKVDKKIIIEVGGSVAKGTWLKDDVDIDIFLLFPKEFGREALKELGLKIACAAVAGHKYRERYAEHPYLEAWVEGRRLNIVPCYWVEDKRWLSAADRSPYHVRYVRAKLNERPLANEIRLFKRFAKGVGVYGSEIRVRGLSGYLCELLVLSYGSFAATLNAITNWRFGEVIDIEELYKYRPKELKRVFQAPLIVIDPIDANRNVAAAVSEEKMSELIAASRLFLNRPSLTFFYPCEEPVSVDDIRRKIASMSFDLMAVIFRTSEKIPDILWGELGKTTRALRMLLETNGFTVLRSSAWSDEDEFSVILLGLDSVRLPYGKRHLGPPGDSKEVLTFLGKYRNVGLSGPWAEGRRWVVCSRRRYVDAAMLIRDKLKNGGRGIGASTRLVDSLKAAEVLVGQDVLSLCTKTGFARYLAHFLDGRPTWLSQIEL
jgi:tRNA nucleotidyltransferase (CCA-adding enzyme)